MRKVIPIILLFLIMGCVGVKNIETKRVEAIYYCINDHPYCRVAEKYLKNIKFLDLDYCNVRDLKNCSNISKKYIGYIYTLPTLIAENKSFNGLFGLLEFMNTLKREGYNIDVPKVSEVLSSIEEVVKNYKSKDVKIFLEYLKEFKNNTTKTRVYFFYSPYCPHCIAVKPYVESLVNKTNITFCNVNDFGNCSSDAKFVATLSGLRGVPTAVVVNSSTAKVLVGEDEIRELEKYV